MRETPLLWESKQQIQSHLGLTLEWRLRLTAVLLGLDGQRMPK